MAGNKRQTITGGHSVNGTLWKTAWTWSDSEFSTGGMKQKGIVSYGIAPNRQKPLAGAFHDAIFNTWRRFSTQVVYWAPPMIAGYYIMNWAIERYGFHGQLQLEPTMTNGCAGMSTSTRRLAVLSSPLRRSKSD